MGREPLPLTPTQQLLFERLSRGYPTSKMLARDLRMNPKRIDKHFEDACRRLAVDNRRQALVIWLKNRDSTPGDHPPGEPIPLHNSISGDNLRAPFDKEGAQNVEMETMEVRDADRASYESPDGGQDHTVSELARSGGPPSPSLRKIAAAGTNPSMGGEDREPGALVAGSNDTRGHIAWNGGNREGPPALLSGLGLGDEHQLTWRAQIGFAVGLVVLIAGCSLIALFAVKELLLQLE